jgi:hypothetical protein
LQLFEGAPCEARLGLAEIPSPSDPRVPTERLQLHAPTLDRFDVREGGGNVTFQIEVIERRTS